MNNAHRHLPIYQCAETTRKAVLQLLDTVASTNKEHDLVRDIQKNANALLDDIETGTRDSSTPEELILYLKQGEMRAAYTFYLLLMSTDLQAIPDNNAQVTARDELDAFLQNVRTLIGNIYDALEAEKNASSS